MTISKENMIAFMEESNRIEDDASPLTDIQINSCCHFISYPVSEASLFYIHYQLTRHLNVDWSGKYRTIDVRVGNWRAPSHQLVSYLMSEYFEIHENLRHFDAHFKYEKIHPFKGFNGRTGRMLWLHKMLKAGSYNPELGFLRSFYYQSLGS